MGMKIISNILHGAGGVTVPATANSWFWVGVCLAITVGAICLAYFAWRRFYGRKAEGIIIPTPKEKVP